MRRSERKYIVDSLNQVGKATALAKILDVNQVVFCDQELDGCKRIANVGVGFWQDGYAKTSCMCIACYYEWTERYMIGGGEIQGLAPFSNTGVTNTGVVLDVA